MDRKEAYATSLIADVIAVFSVIGIGYLAQFILNSHPLMKFLSSYNLAYVNQHPEILPPESVLFSGIALLITVAVIGTGLAVGIFFKTRFIIFNKLVHNKWNQVKTKTSLKLILLQIPLFVIPIWFVLYVLSTMLIFLTNLIDYIPVVVFLQQFVLTLTLSTALYLLVEYSLYFYKNPHFFRNYVEFLYSIRFKKMGRILGIISVFFLAVFTTQNILSNFYTIAYLESAFYYTASFLILSIIRVETYLQDRTAHTQK